MGHEAMKLELIEWLTRLEDAETIQYLKVLKDSNPMDHSWWENLPDYQKLAIEKGLKDIDEGRTSPHEEVKKKYGL